MNNNLLDTFLHLAEKDFSFLLNFGFSLYKKEKLGAKYAKVVYEHRELFVKITFDCYSFEIEFSVFHKKSNQEYFLKDLTCFYNASSSFAFASLQVSTSESLERALNKVSNFILTHKELFCQAEVVFGELYKFVTKDAKKNGDFDFDHVKKKAETAWGNRDYEQVFRLYEPFQEWFGKIEKARFLYAKNQLNKN